MSEPAVSFDYDVAFSRNLGLFTAVEQARLRQAHVVVAGLGGVGGYYVALLARAGVGGLTLVDLDRFELVNFNRQHGAMVSTIGQPKLDVMLRMAQDINPQLRLRSEPRGVQVDTVDEVLAGADLVIDAMDVFEVAAHQLLVDRATARGLTTIAAVPLGLGAAMLAFGPGGMSFARYFALRPGMTPLEQVVQFALGFAPAGLHLKYLDLGAVDLEHRRGPSFGGACMLCGGLVVSEAVAVVLGWRPARLVPIYQQFDPQVGCYRRGRLRWGNRGPVQRLKRWVVERRYRAAHGAAPGGDREGG